MKKAIIVFGFLFAFIIGITAQNRSVVQSVFVEYVEAKVDKYQEIIKFNDNQAEQIKQLELDYLIQVEKAENCWYCFTKKRVEKEKLKKYKGIEKILSRSEYIQYKALDNQEIQLMPLWAK